MIVIFVGALVGICVLVAILVLFNEPPPPEGCPVGELCPPQAPASLQPRPSQQPGQTLSPLQTPAPTPAGQTPGPGASSAPTPASNAAPFVGGAVWRSATLGYSFEYDSDLWDLEESTDDYARLRVFSSRYNIEFDVLGFPGDVSVDEALQAIYQQTDSLVIGRSPNTRTYDALLGAGIGYVRGDGDVFSGTFKNADGSPGDGAGITVMAATNGRLTLAVVVLVHDPETDLGGMTLQHAARDLADKIVKTVIWETGE